MFFQLRRLALSGSCFVVLLGCLFPAIAGAQSIQNRVDPMSKEAFALSIKQAALTVCALRRLDMDYKIALNTSATPVFQLVKFQYGMDIEGNDEKLDEQRFIRFLGYKISEITLEACKEILPPNVELTIQKIKDKLNP
ncbi:MULTISPECIES: hypothetical protein [unclassified Synechococcus]|uniref:hypothetical protein n=1 Tax=unclassified Synechococcus TaxID=2626047 RepID=UPI0012E873FA|nr:MULTISPECIES: hypothetical protein [unclassified Synechococcus]